IRRASASFAEIPVFSVGVSMGSYPLLLMRITSSSPGQGWRRSLAYLFATLWPHSRTAHRHRLAQRNVAINRPNPILQFFEAQAVAALALRPDAPEPILFYGHFIMQPPQHPRSGDIHVGSV